jgi:hypothetical protein
MKNWQKRYIGCAIFAVAFAYIESSVVVYLRALYYPQGFAFPLKQTSPSVYLTEAGREVATIVVSFLWKGRSVLDHEVPRGYPWWLWGSGVVLGLGIFLARVLRSRRIRKG